MKNRRSIVCFGDSNTYGAVPTLARTGRRRYAASRRWPGVMQRRLGSGWVVVEEGHPGRTSVFDDPIEGRHKNGLAALPVVLESHMPLDVLVVMLGTNDLKHRFSLTTGDIADAIEVLVTAALGSGAGPGGADPGVILVAPPPLLEVDWFAEMFRGGAVKSRELPDRLRAAAGRLGVPFLDAGQIVSSSATDGIHLEASDHKTLGEAVAELILQRFG